MSSINLKGINKSYKGITAIRNLSLDIPQGSLFGLLGPNGAGKTTLLKVITTLVEPDSGEVLICGFNALKESKDIRKKIGYVAQEVALDKILSGKELLDLQGDLYHIDKKNKEERIEDLITQLDMSEWINRRTGSYSGGMKRRLDLAAGLIHNPDILILDEPTVGLDIESRNVIWDLLRDFSKQNKTVLLSSHYLDEIDQLADNLAIIDKGKLIANGSKAELKKKLGASRITLKVKEFSNESEALIIKHIIEKLPYIKGVVINKSQGFSVNFFADENKFILDNIKEQLAINNYEIFSLAQSQPSLDDVYLEATGKTLLDAEIDMTGQRDLKKELKQSMR
tara:strand:+ start:6290 stop:7306 length:1017 start_codon:yes stop_codon:yes gene_type:complete